LRAGSPKKRSPPCSSIASSPRWIAPMLAVDTLPYPVMNCLALGQAVEQRLQLFRGEH